MESFGFNNYGWNDNIQNEEQAFARVPLVFRAVNLICDTLKQVPLYVYDESDNIIDAYPFQAETPIKDLIWKAQASRLLRGATLIIKLLDQTDNNIGLQLLAPFTFHVKQIDVRDPITGNPGKETVFEQNVGGQRYPQQGYWHKDEVIYIREYSPADDIGVGIAPAFTSLNAAKLQRYIMRFASHFFEHGAMPIALASLPGDTDPSVVKNVENSLRNSMRGLVNAFGVTAVSGEIDIKKFTPDLDKLELKGTRDNALEEVAWAFKIPKTILSSESANYATAEEEMKLFIMGTISGLCEGYEEAFNSQFIKLPTPCKIEYAIDEMHAMQVDEWRRSQAFKNYVDGGLPPAVAAIQVGLELDDSALQLLKQKGNSSGDPEDITDVVVKAELARWMTKILRKHREGKHLQVEFKSEVMPIGIKEKIKAELKYIRTEKEIRQLFAQAGMNQLTA
jgi:HK97 family phage portal protein